MVCFLKRSTGQDSQETPEESDRLSPDSWKLRADYTAVSVDQWSNSIWATGGSQNRIWEGRKDNVTDAYRPQTDTWEWGSSAVNGSRMQPPRRWGEDARTCTWTETMGVCFEPYSKPPSGFFCLHVVVHVQSLYDKGLMLLLWQWELFSFQIQDW